MIRERIFTISTLLAFVVLSGVAHAEPALTRKGTRVVLQARPDGPSLTGIARAPCRKGRCPPRSCERGPAAQLDAATGIQVGPKGLPITC